MKPAAAAPGTNRLAQPLSRLLADALDAGAADSGLRDWHPVVQAWWNSPAGQTLVRAVDARLAAGAVVYPADPLRALRSTALADTRVVILGQDPYHGPGQAEGLAFSVPAGVPLPPSLRNIVKELQRDLGCALPVSGSLLAWAGQGVLLLNTCLTVEQGQAGSHARLGWQTLTDALVSAAAADQRPKVFLLWGAHAQAQAGHIAASGGAHAVLMANHPSPLSALRPPAPFIGCGHFGQANRLLRAQGRGEIRWDLVKSESVV